MKTTLKLSGKFYQPSWFILDEKSGKLLSVSLELTNKLKDAWEFEDEEEAKVEVTHIVQHPETYPQLPTSLALRIVSRAEVMSMQRPKGAVSCDPAPIAATPAAEKDEWKGVYPGMCINPETCRGKTHCPRSLSCCE